MGKLKTFMDEVGTKGFVALVMAAAFVFMFVKYTIFN